jgi:hypothetical protein
MLYAKASPTPEIDCLFFLGTVRGRNVFVNGMFKFVESLYHLPPD